MNTFRVRDRNFRQLLALVFVLSFGLLSAPLRASASVTLVGSLTGYKNIEDSLVSAAVKGSISEAQFDNLAGKWDAVELSQKTLERVIANDQLYIEASVKAGPSAEQLIGDMATFQELALRELESQVFPIKVFQLRQIIQRAIEGTLATHYIERDNHVGVFFGPGLARVIWDEHDARRFKIQSLPDPADSQNYHQYLVRDGDSVTFPVALTGVLAQFRERQPVVPPTHKFGLRHLHLGYGLRWLSQKLQPTAVFGSLQLAGGDVGTVGVAIGLGWQVVGDIHLLIGYNSTKLGTIRDDLHNEIDASMKDRLRIDDRETEDSIKGTEVSNGIVVVVAIPIALKSVFGSGR